MTRSQYLRICAILLAGSFAGGFLAGGGIGAVHAQAPDAMNIRARAFTLAELRRIQTERIYRKIPNGFDTGTLGQASCRQLDPAALVMNQLAAELHAREVQQDSAKQSQSHPVPTASIARNALCPCRSGEKYKRCCGTSAPPLLSPSGTGFQPVQA